MNKTCLQQRIQEVFGGVARPPVPTNSYAFSFEYAFAANPADEVPPKEFWNALYDLNPPLQNGTQLLRYILPRCLRLSFFENAEDVEREIHRDQEEVQERTGALCYRWKPAFHPHEVQLIDEVFWSALRDDWRRTDAISGFYFSLLVLWERHVPDFSCLGSAAALAIRTLQARLCAVMEGYRHVQPFSAFDAVFDVYGERELRPMCNMSIIQDWNREIITQPKHSLYATLSTEGVDRLSDELIQFTDSAR